MIHAALATKELLPAEYLVDAGYVDAEILVSSQTEHQIEVIGPVATYHSWQARAQTGFDVACFAIDWQAQIVTCLRGHASRKWSATYDQGRPVINIRFEAKMCAACPVRQRCTHSATGPRELTLHPRE